MAEIAKPNQKAEFNKRFEALKQEYFKWQPGHKELSTYIDPTRGIFNGDRSVIGKPINHKILIDSQATDSKNVTASGLQTGLTNPVHPWFKLTLDKLILDNVPGVKEWLEDVTNRMIEVINKSNLHNVFYGAYEELVQFGTACFLILEDFDDVVRGRSFTCGEYFLGIDNKGRVNTFAREFDMTVGQMVKEFGLESCSPNVQAEYRQNKVDATFKVRHLIEANDTRIPGYEDFKNMPFRSVYWEAGAYSDKYLQLRGYKRFNIVAPRWKTITTEMVYGYGPGHHAIGDIKQLQTVNRDKLIAANKAYDPPMIEDASVNGQSNYLPGGRTKVSTAGQNAGARPAYQINPNLEAMENDIQRLHEKIDRRFFASVFLMITNTGNPSETAFAVAQKEQEKLTLLGPILHNLNETLGNVIDIVFGIMLDNGLIPPPPQDLGNAEIKVQYISILAQAQKSIGVDQIDRVLTRAGNLASMGRTDAWDLVDIDEAMRESADMGGAPAKIIKEQQEVDAIRQARQQQEQQMMAMQAGAQAADAASKLGKTPMNQGSVLDGIAHAAGQMNR